MNKKVINIINYVITLGPLVLFFYIKWYWVVLIYNILLAHTGSTAWKNTKKPKLSFLKAVTIPLFFNFFGIAYVLLKLAEKTKTNEIEGLEWFNGVIGDDNLKIRKYHLTNRYVFSPRVIWLDLISSSVINYFLSFMYSNCNYEMSLGGGGINSMELKINEEENLGEEITFKSLESKKHLEESIQMFKKNFPDNYNLIFNDNTVDDVTELSKYKMMVDPWMFSTSIENEIKEQKRSPKQFFNKKYLSVSKSYNKDFKEWIVLDNSLKPIGITYDSDSKEDCINWINSWDN